MFDLILPGCAVDSNNIELHVVVDFKRVNVCYSRADQAHRFVAVDGFERIVIVGAF